MRRTVAVGKQRRHCVDERQSLGKPDLLGPDDADRSREQHGGRGRHDRFAEPLDVAGGARGIKPRYAEPDQAVVSVGQPDVLVYSLVQPE